jgi:hypothetical protein
MRPGDLENEIEIHFQNQLTGLQSKFTARACPVIYITPFYTSGDPIPCLPFIIFPSKLITDCLHWSES